jgi:hypothetical protein
MLENCFPERTTVICAFRGLLVALVGSAILVGAQGTVDASSLDEEMDLPQPIGVEADPLTSTALLSDLLGPQLALLEVVPQLPPRLRDASSGDMPLFLAAATGSGLAWKSGACGDPGIANFRKRPLDTSWFGLPKSSFSAMIRQSKSSGLRAAANRAPQVVVSVPLLTQETSLNHAACAAGNFDRYFLEIGANLKNNGADDAIIRLGKEANRGVPPYGYDSDADLENYRNCFRNAAKALKQGGGTGLTIEWTNARQTLSSVNVLNAYPGGDVVDHIGVHYYNNPKLGRMSTQEQWDRQYSQRYASGGPLGIGSWLADAKNKFGKTLAISEWGLWGNSAVADNPVYIENMFRFFKANAASLAYESYFNCASLHYIYPTSIYKNARERYRALWSAG